MNVEPFVRIARVLMDTLNYSIDDAVANQAIPQPLKEQVKMILEQERLITIRDPYMIEDPNREHIEWLSKVDRANWYYWPRLRNYLLDKKGWPEATVRSIDDSTDRILAAMENPIGDKDFDTRALVVGYVQSGKTANYTALIAKAADTGYRLIIVLAGIHNTLRYQTQVRLDRELVGLMNGVSVGVGRPILEKVWHTFTKADLNNGDFAPGNASTAALNGTNPVLMVVKKNGPVLRRLLRWLEQTHEETRKNLPCLIIDDEADQASVNTGGNRPVDGDPEENVDTESPSVINGLIRSILNLFKKKAYIAYTATPFANVLIDHRAEDIHAGRDLYPRSFIVALPRPHGYYGAAEIFGSDEGDKEGLNIIRHVPEEDIHWLVPERRSEVDSFQPRIPKSLKRAIKDFMLAGAARKYRSRKDEPSAMLIHTSYRTLIQKRLAELIEEEFRKLRDEWRYFRNDGLREELKNIWETDFRPTTRETSLESDVPFEMIEEHISPFIEQVVIRQVHSDSDNDEIDYERDPVLKVIAIGGNRLSRGLTLEGLLVSYFVRSSATYDTLMQMGRWFGYREGYADLTRIYTTPTLERWFRDLATVEEELHREIARYEREKLTPLQVGVKIRQHPAMLVTSPLKMRAAQTVNVSLENQLLQTITFPLNDIEFLKSNLEATRRFLGSIGDPYENSDASRLVWYLDKPDRILDFLSEYRTDPEATIVRADRIREYIREQNKYGELTRWTVAVVGRNQFNQKLGQVDLNIKNHPAINLIERTRIKGTYSLKAITSRQDQALGLSDEQKEKARELADSKNMTYPEAIRYVMSPQQGLLLLYPISKYSGYNLGDNPNREPLFLKPEQGEHVIGLAMVFPRSTTAATVQYIVGSVGTGSK